MGTCESANCCAQRDRTAGMETTGAAPTLAHPEFSPRVPPEGPDDDEAPSEPAAEPVTPLAEDPSGTGGSPTDKIAGPSKPCSLSAMSLSRTDVEKLSKFQGEIKNMISSLEDARTRTTTLQEENAKLAEDKATLQAENEALRKELSRADSQSSANKLAAWGWRVRAGMGA
mmetsp:Transcript_60176/g.135715  ORF Transcript_60176/g.135715 Transcript_60176/m.135715 type:complete len:171 (-) Transcript_60176:37-549(-)